MKGKFCTIVTSSDISNSRTTEDIKQMLVQVKFEFMMILKKQTTMSKHGKIQCKTP